MQRFKIEKLPGTNKIVEDILSRGKDLILKLNMKVMVTENIDVENGICNGTIGHIIRFNENNIEIKTLIDKIINITYHKIDAHKIKFSNYDEKLDNHYSIVNEFIPLKQCNAITIHKSQGMTYDNVILNCNGIFASSMFYTAISRVRDPKNMKILNFKDSYIKVNKTAFEYETEGKYMTYFEKMLIDNDEDKLNCLTIKPPEDILKDNSIFYDFECASDGNLGHRPYFNHMIKLYDGKIDEEKTFLHYYNSNDVNRDTFDYIMNIVTYQCDKYLIGIKKRINK